MNCKRYKFHFRKRKYQVKSLVVTILVTDINNNRKKEGNWEDGRLGGHYCLQLP